MNLNDLSPAEAETGFLSCCGSRTWARRMTEGRPYGDGATLLETADQVWWSLAPEDWGEAFAAHPQIGEKKIEGDDRFRRWSEQEQAGVASAETALLAELAEANRAYAERFGYIFIVCATGKSAGEMLGLLRSRLGNDPETELRVAAEEQRKITRLRLLKAEA
ncbi:MAG TPA: 2-oxo-4-hydroxy-4-carboxy-5-ureidoimidazoline decarboxylase [Thermoanaerobaculia bacterium]|nr:2-oxo-4-hydroxy-4-carboxy-5-ureidoimidazoline decarboxylase [Thermoanaerobaculia bacterium]